MRCAVFDLDGTLADTSGDLLDAANAQFQALGLGAPLTAAADRDVALTGGRAMLRRGALKLGLDDVEAFTIAHYQALLAHYSQNLVTKTRLYDGARAVLDQLRTEGWVLAVCTNKPVNLAEGVIAGLGLQNHFAKLIGAGSLAVVKPDAAMMMAVLEPLGVQPPDAVLIGDTVTDYLTAQNSGTGLILVDFDATDIGARYPDVPLARDFYAVYTHLTGRAWASEK